LARGVAGDDWALEFLSPLPYAKQQPNLLFAAVRSICGMPDGWQEFRHLLAERPDAIRETMLTHRTQTNEPARCAVLLPLLALLPQPLALLEVGASAGLCLLPDRFAYRFNGVDLDPVSQSGPPPPRFSCATDPQTPIPKSPIQVAWRTGLDLSPVNLRDNDQVAWLETLVWPGEENRLELLRQAIEIARSDPPSVVRGDLRTDLPALASQAPKDATLVVFHSAVLAYIQSPWEREEFARAVARIGAIWIANESPKVIPGLADAGCQLAHPGEFLVAMDGIPIAASDPHGKTLRWL
jgi:hypothetical protein